MWYIIIGLIVFMILWSVVKWLFKFLIEHWQIPVGAIIGYLVYGVVGALIGIASIYLLTLLFKWFEKLVEKSNERKFYNYLGKKYSRMGYVTVDQLAEQTVQYSTQKYETSYRSIIQRFISESTQKHYASNNIPVWNGVRGYLEQWFNYNQAATSIDAKDICRNCNDIFIWTRNESSEKLLLNALNGNNELFGQFDVQRVTIEGEERVVISSMEKVETYDDDEWRNL